MIELELYEAVAYGRGSEVVITPKALDEFKEAWEKSSLGPLKNLKRAFRKRLQGVTELPRALCEIVDPGSGAGSGEGYCVRCGPFLFILQKTGGGYVATRVMQIPHSIHFPKKRGNDLPISEVRFSSHALTRFRPLVKGEGVENLLVAARLCLFFASEEGAISREGKVVRMLDHEFKPDRYFLFGQLRFVVTYKKDGPLVVTIERKILQ